MLAKDSYPTEVDFGYWWSHSCCAAVGSLGSAPNSPRRLSQSSRVLTNLASSLHLPSTPHSIEPTSRQLPDIRPRGSLLDCCPSFEDTHSSAISEAAGRSSQVRYQPPRSLTNPSSEYPRTTCSLRSSHSLLTHSPPWLSRPSSPSSWE
jgi:hypothetical protein